MNALIWVPTIGLGAALLLQGFVLRAAHRRKEALLKAEQLQLQQSMDGKLERTKSQIGQLQIDLATARLQIKQLGKRSATSVRDSARARRELERELDKTTESHHSSGADGFADTQPSPEITQHGNLLLQ